MNPTKKYKKEIIKMFYISVKKDIEQWTAGSNYENFFSQDLNGYSLNIDLNNDRLYINDNSSDTYTEICRYRYFHIPIKLKMYFYVIKLIIHFKNIKEYEKHKEEANTLKIALSNIQETYKKEIRKEKLENLK